VTESVVVGNAAVDALPYGGWILGHFVDEADGVRHSDDVEVKWDVHRRGEARSTWVRNDDRTAICILFSGKIRLSFPDREVVLADQGDYVMWTATDHTWLVEEDCVAVVVRWPSLPGFAPDRSTATA
jgi:hypothetical protein